MQGIKVQTQSIQMWGTGWKNNPLSPLNLRGSNLCPEIIESTRSIKPWEWPSTENKNSVTMLDLAKSVALKWLVEPHSKLGLWQFSFFSALFLYSLKNSYHFMSTTLAHMSACLMRTGNGMSVLRRRSARRASHQINIERMKTTPSIWITGLNNTN